MTKTAAVLAMLAAQVACGPACPDERCSARTPEYRRAQDNAARPPEPSATETTAAAATGTEAAPATETAAAAPATETAPATPVENAPAEKAAPAEKPAPAPAAGAATNVAVTQTNDVEKIDLTPPAKEHTYSIVKLAAPEIGMVPAIDIAEVPEKDPAIRARRFELVNTSDRLIRLWVYDLRLCKDGTFLSNKVFASLSPRGTKNLDRTRVGLDYSKASLSRCSTDVESDPPALQGTYRLILVPVDGKAWRDDATLKHTSAGMKVNELIDRLDVRLRSYVAPRR